MPPKRGGGRSRGAASRGRGSNRGRKRAGRDHTRVLSDITEESTPQLSEQPATAKPSSQRRAASNPKKRSFNQDAETEEASIPAATGTKRETRAQTAKRVKRIHEISLEAMSTDETSERTQDQARGCEVGKLVARVTFPILPYTPSATLFSFAHFSGLDSDVDTETLALNLIELTLTDENWHPDLSGMVQPASCFLIASLLTRRQNLVEDIAASVQEFDIGFEELVKGYALLWEWRDNMRGVIGGYEERLEGLPEPFLLLGPASHDEVHFGQQEGNDEAFDERPEPERWDVQVIDV